MFLWCVMAEETREAAAAGEQKQRMYALERRIERMAQGDTESLSVFYEETSAAVYGFVLSILKQRSDAEDVMQETYLNIYRAAGRYRPNGNPMPWILTIARNLALMKLRERNRQSRADQEILEAELVKLTAGTEVSQEDRLMLRMVLQVLSAEELQIVMLHAVAGCKHREIAQLLELPLPTVLSKYHRALKKLRKQWEEGNE